MRHLKGIMKLYAVLVAAFGNCTQSYDVIVHVMLLVTTPRTRKASCTK